MHPGRNTKQWSKLKVAVEGLFAPSVAGRVELRYTRYRGTHDQTGRGYISVDGKELWNMCTLRFWKEEREKFNAWLEETGEPPRTAPQDVESELIKNGILAEWDFFRTLDEYRNASIEENLASENPLKRSLVMLDARFGKRRLVGFDTSTEHEMVQYFHAFRCSVEATSAQ